MLIFSREGAVSINWARSEHASSDEKLAVLDIQRWSMVARQLDSHRHLNNSDVNSVEK